LSPSWCLAGNRPGFTLIELLVIVAVISILAALLFPAFSSAKRKARDVQCMQNLKTWGVVMSAYAADLDIQVYLAESGINWMDGAGSPYLPYFSSDLKTAQRLLMKARVCPGNTAQSVNDDTPGYKAALKQGGENYIRLPALAQTSRHVLLSDAVGSNQTYEKGELDAKIKPICVGPAPVGDVIRHAGKAHVLWADFHISAEPYAEFVINKEIWFD
jgi:prepilin-type N-terminal cleavage/methylation domain-containing protein/prepilin-type processing-associated H-X9-DG protein